MPYIKQEDRNNLYALITRLGVEINTAGELNYTITKLVIMYLQGCQASRGVRFNYSGIATVTGVLENVKQEFYRRAATPYEDLKIKENGDVYGE